MFRLYVARAVVVLYVFLLVPVGDAVYQLTVGDTDSVSTDMLRWVVWLVAFIPLTGALVAAVRVFRTADRDRSWRATGWAAGLFLLGIALITTEAIITDAGGHTGS
jgi:hypothetical protein